MIRNADGSLFKVGESAQGVRVGDGLSIRAEQQARALQRETGDVYRTQIRQNFDGKADARAYETKFIQITVSDYGVSGLRCHGLRCQVQQPLNLTSPPHTHSLA